MTKLKDYQNEKEKVKSSVQPISKVCFSFEHFTTNKSYNTNYFFKKHDTKGYQSFVEKLKELSCKNYSELILLGKEKGFETINYSELKDNMKTLCKNTSVVSSDSKLTISRFCNQEYRILLKSDINHNNLLYVIALEMDYSAYNH